MARFICAHSAGVSTKLKAASLCRNFTTGFRKLLDIKEDNQFSSFPTVRQFSSSKDIFKRDSNDNTEKKSIDLSDLPDHLAVRGGSGRGFGVIQDVLDNNFSGNQIDIRYIASFSI